MLIVTHFTPNEQLTLEMRSGEEESYPIASAVITAVIGLPLYILGVYCFLAGRSIPSGQYAMIGEALMLALGLFILFMPAPRLLRFTPGESPKQCRIATHYRLGLMNLVLKREVTYPQVTLYFKRGVMGEACVELRCKYGDKQNVATTHSITYVNNAEDVEELAYCLASATRFASLAKVEDGATAKFMLSGNPAPGDLAVPAVPRGLPRLSVECLKSAPEHLLFTPARAALIGEIVASQAERCLELKQELPTQEPAYRLFRWSCLLVVPAAFWVLAVVRSWPEAELHARVIWCASSVIFGATTLFTAVLRFGIGTHTRTRIDKEKGVHITDGPFFTSKVRPDVIERLYVDFEKRNETYQLRLFAVAGRNTKSIVKSTWLPNADEASAAMLSLALECGRILNRPVYAPPDMIASFKSNSQL